MSNKHRQRLRQRRRASGLRIERLEPRTLLAAEALGLGGGLAADYFADPAMTNLTATRVDAQVNFNWGAGAPLAGLPADGFAVRWNGKIQAPTSETYTFYATTAADDGLRFTIYTADLSAAGGRKAHTLIDTWSAHTAAEQSGALALTAGETYDVLVEYTNSTGSANVALSWSSPTTAKALLPTAQLYPTQSLSVSSIGGNWLNTDIGAPTLAGAFTSQGKVFTISGAGGGIGGASDQFQFAYQVLQGEGIAVVKVDALTGANLDPNAKAGLMVRDGTGASSVYAGLFLTPTGGVSFSYRDTVGQAATVTTQAGITAPYWLKLVRRGPTVNAYMSATGADDAWTFVGRADVKGLGDAVLLGVAATSNNTAATATAVLTNVALSADLPLGGGLGHLTSYYPQLPFIDLIKGGSGTALKLEASGNLSNTNTPANLDTSGWPTEDFGFRGPYAQKSDALTGRDFTLTFTGQADVSIVSPSIGTATPANDSGYASGYNSATNTSKWILRCSDASGGNGTGLSCRFQNTQRTETSTTGTGVTNIQLLHPGYASYDSQHVFTQEWLDLLRPLTEIRLKDWAFVDGNRTTDWSQRTLPATPNQIGWGGFNSPYGGVAWEYLVQIANAAHKDVWLSIPARVNNDYLLKLAQLIRYGSDGTTPYTSPQANPVFPGLAPDLNVYLEYGNEIWNGQFDSNAYAQGQAWAAYQAHTTYGPNQVTLDYDGRMWTSSNNQDLIYRWIAAHLKQDIIDTWVGVFGAGAINTRIRPVLVGWVAYPDRTCEEGLKLLQAAGWTPHDSLYAISVAGYYGYNDLAAAQVTTNAARDSATKEETLQLFAAAATAARGGLGWPISTAIASAYGLKLAAYEAGPSLGTNYAQGAAQMDPAFAGVQNAIINSWYASGAEQYNYSFILFLNNYGSSQGDFILGDNPWDRNQPREQSIYALASATSAPPVTDGFTALPSGELEARHYINNTTTAQMYLVEPPNWQATATYRYMIRSLTDQDVDLRISAASTAANDRIQVRANAASVYSYTYAAASSTDPAGNVRYADLGPITVHLNPGLNEIELTLDNAVTSTASKPAVNSLKFSPVGGSLTNTLPWAFGLPGNMLNSPLTAQNIAENATMSFGVDIQDQETPAVAGQASPFTITAVSDNPALLPNDASHIGLTYNTSNTRWLLALTPTANMTGKLNLTVTIADAAGARRTYVLPINVIPPNPSSVTATAAADGAVTLSWNNNSRVNPTYKIERSVGPINGNDWSQVALNGATAYGAASWTDNPPGGASYYYRITAIDAAGVTGNIAYANSSAAVAVPSVSTVGIGLNATHLFSGKTYFASSVDSVAGGRIVGAAFDGTNQYFAFTVSVYYSTADYSGSGQATALNSAGYTQIGSSSYALYQSGVSPVTTQPDGVQAATVSGLAIPAGSKSVLLKFDASSYAPSLAEVQAFSAAAIGTAAPTDVSYTTAWRQFSPSTFANYVGATVNLTWTNPTGSSTATTFVVERDTTSAFNTANLRTWYTPLNNTSFLNDRDNQNRPLNPYAPTWDANNHNTPLPGGAAYFYRVGARQADGSVAWSASPLTVATAAASYPIAAPTSLTATAVSAYQIDLSWTAVPGATGYKIEKSTKSNFTDTNYALALVTGASYFDPTVTPNSVWCYRVRAVSAGGDSDWATLGGSVTAQSITGAPTGVTASADEGTVHLTWTPGTGKNYAYEIYRGTTSDSLSPYKTYVQGASEIVWPAFTDTGLPANTTYYYAVRGAYWSNNTNPSQVQYTSLSTAVSATTLADQTDQTPPQIVSWASVRTHAIVGDASLVIPDTGLFSEPRTGGVQRLLIAFSEPIAAGSLLASNVQFAGNNASGAALNLSLYTVSVSLRDDSTAELAFSAALPDRAKYTVRLSGVTDAAGNALAGDNDRVFTNLQGDSSGDLRTNVTDLSYIQSARVNPINPSVVKQVRSDVNLDGRANATDLSASWAMRSADLRSVAAPILSSGSSPLGTSTTLMVGSARASRPTSASGPPNMSSPLAAATVPARSTSTTASSTTISLPLGAKPLPPAVDAVLSAWFQ